MSILNIEKQEPLTLERVKREAEDAKKSPELALKSIDKFVRYFEIADHHYNQLRKLLEAK